MKRFLNLYGFQKLHGMLVDFVQYNIPPQNAYKTNEYFFFYKTNKYFFYLWHLFNLYGFQKIVWNACGGSKV